MGDYNSVRTHHDYMSISIYNFLDNLLAAVRPSETLDSESNSRDQINSQVKPGGYSEDIFIFLSDREKEEYNCSVCYSVVKDVHQCRNGHKFCYSCIYVWSTCNRTGADCCPACRCDGVYARNDQLNEKIGRKRVKCISDGCNWRGFLRDYNEHEHRTYDFRELNTSIELPFIKAKESSSSNLLNSSIMNKVDSSEATKSDDENTFVMGDLTANNHGGGGGASGNVREKLDEQTNIASVATTAGRVSRTSLAPRRLIRNNGNNIAPGGGGGRSSILQPSLANYSRSTNISTRCPPTYRHSVSNSRLSRLPRNTATGSNPLSHDNIHTESPSRQTAHSEYTQTNSFDSSNPPPPPAAEATNFYSENSDSNVARSGGATATPRRSLQLPAINHSNTNHVSSDRGTQAQAQQQQQQMEYRRLAPTYASRRSNFVVTQTEGREQLAMMLILLTSDLEDRVTLSDLSLSSHDPIGSENNVSIIENSSSSTSTATATFANNPSNANANRPGGGGGARLGRSRLQEFRNLNRRLSEVANSLDRLIASTGREGERVLHNTTFSGSPESLNSDTSSSDVDEEFNSSNGCYR